jgi:hypothetical protein
MEATTLHLQSQTVGGNDFISMKHEQFDGLLHDYNPYFSCVFVPAEHRERDLSEFCYAIISTIPGRQPYVVRWLTDEMLNDPAKIMLWIWEGDPDRQNSNDILARLDAEEKFKRLAQMRAEAEVKEEMIDLTVAVVRGGRDRKNYFRHGGVTYK